MKKNLLKAMLLSAVFTGYAQSNGNEKGDILITASANFSQRLAKIDNGIQGEARDYLKKLKSGFSYDVAAYYLLTPKVGVGLKYNAFKSTGSIGPVEAMEPNGAMGVSVLKDDITISFYALAAYIDFLENSERHSLYMDVAVGYMHYNNNAHILQDYKITSGTFGSSVNFTYQYLLAKGFTAGPRIGFAGGSLTRFKYKAADGFSMTQKLDSEDAESLLRIDLGLQASYSF